MQQLSTVWLKENEYNWDSLVFALDCIIFYDEKKNWSVDEKMGMLVKFLKENNINISVPCKYILPQ